MPTQRTERICLLLLLVFLVAGMPQTGRSEPRDFDAKGLDRCFAKFINVLTRNGEDKVGVKLFGRLRMRMTLPEVKSILPDIQPNPKLDNRYSTRNGLFGLYFEDGRLYRVEVRITQLGLIAQDERYQEYVARLSKAFGAPTSNQSNGGDVTWGLQIVGGKELKGYDPNRGVGLDVSIILLSLGAPTYSDMSIVFTEHTY